ncbi:GNAT family acetyltransferase [Neobacillus bataviensis LMG 21833]|uniref:GNAT family acetyltransferase n=1 Tax=Neobacillus bataviensis LMG 21833 TaxID=1117379 RepID=K6DB39_9BACI|nr:GNAT family N-acetyltransferase [Neobacillus bataviensis]EKN69757.1 GNAT family acetyltransferase [Neobacillus bataviensis LMG 21833]
MEKEQISLAKTGDLARIERLFQDCKEALQQKGIYQWDDEYPNKEYFAHTINEKEMFILHNESEILGAMVLNEWEIAEWDAVDWSNKNGNYLVLHSFCTHPTVQGKGLGGIMLQFAEKMAKEQGYDGIRLDAYSGNKGSLGFYEKRGYNKTGEVFFSSKPAEHGTYFCYEKLF